MFKKTKCVLDIMPYNQTGYTMRTFEALASGCKLISNNEKLRNAEFFKDDFIHIYNSVDDIDIEFVKEKRQKYDPIIEKYSFDNWIKNIVINKDKKH